MPAWVNEVHRIIATIAIQVQTVDGFGVQVGSVIRGDKSSPLGAIIPGVAVIQASVVIAVVAAIDLIIHIILRTVKKNHFLFQMRTLNVHIVCYSLVVTLRKEYTEYMEEVEVVLARHEQCIKTLEREMADMKTVQAEIRSMNDTLVTLTTELKYANEHLARHEQKIDEIKSAPSLRMQQISTAIISALAGCIISMLLNTAMN
jgi:hypothetical protein